MQKILFAVVFSILLNFGTVVAKAETAIFAGGCFWCVESDFDSIKGVLKTTSGYAGGSISNPTYKNHEGNQEAVKIEFDPIIISYDKLVSFFLRTIDVTDAGGQFCDRGKPYTSVIFAKGAEQKDIAEKAVKAAEAELGLRIVTPVVSASSFSAAEAYHQNYHLGQNRVVTRFGWIKQAEAYQRYREACGRDARVKKIWGAAAYPTIN